MQYSKGLNMLQNVIKIERDLLELTSIEFTLNVVMISIISKSD